ncbi:LysR family transcriptional regulator [Glaciecola sp. KUL10]|uniref:LysR family transcriptional regulator n=1 Tax=Glaciecola sp. (strain KUL10) TaxID=2161813 RepID=UPI000D78AF8F|nr:LysR family transcriptional regulator [Glaciecola sp. KUL10]GBL05660.1 bacterial regulatory protein LysR Family [Glaciecola sp. KUL10]
MRQLSLDNLRTLVTVIETGSYQKAGELVGRSQPAISLQIKKLEAQINKKLFDKFGQRYQANSHGMWLYEQAKTMLQINDQIFTEFEQETLKGRLRFGIPSEFATRLLPSIIGEFNNRYPDVSLDVSSALSRQLLSVNQRNQYDLVLALISSQQSSDGELLLEDELVWVGDSRLPLPKKKLSLVLAPDGCMYRSQAIQVLKQQTIEWRIAYTNTDLYGLIAAIKQGLGITVLAKSSVPPELEIIKHPMLPELGTINICLFNQNSQHPQVSATLSEFIRNRVQHLL